MSNKKIHNIILRQSANSVKQIAKVEFENNDVEYFNPTNVDERAYYLDNLIDKNTRFIDMRIGYLKFSDFIKDRDNFTKKIVKNFKESGYTYDPAVQGCITAMKFTGHLGDVDCKVKLAFAFGGYTEIDCTWDALDIYMEGITGYTYIFDKRVEEKKGD